MQLIPHIILISAVTVGAYLAAKELIFTFIKDPDELYGELSEPAQKLVKPLFYCPTCMASVWGTSLHFIFGGDFDTWIPVVLASAFVNTLFNRWVN
jgi:hypothetical protein